MVLSRRDLVPATVRAEWSASACKRLVDELRRRQSAAQRRMTVASFVSFRSEIDTGCVHAALLREPSLFRLALPRVSLKERALQFFAVDNVDEGSALQRSRFGILEPNRRNSDNVALKVSDLDVVVTPGVAFNVDGARLGHGGGFYDRVLAGRRADVPALAYAFECQVLRDDLVPMNPTHDFKVDQIVTEAQTIDCGQFSGQQN